jgi:hypothetical protein
LGAGSQSSRLGLHPHRPQAQNRIMGTHRLCIETHPLIGHAEMLPIDDVQNALLRRDGVLRFVPQDQCDLFRAALARLEHDGYRVCRISLMSVETELQLLHGISAMTSAPWVMENWGMFEDWMNKLSFLVPVGRGCFFCMDYALPFWQKRTSLAGALSNQLQSTSFQWAPRGRFLLGLYELR